MKLPQRQVQLYRVLLLWMSLLQVVVLALCYSPGRISNLPISYASPRISGCRRIIRRDLMKKHATIGRPSSFFDTPVKGGVRNVISETEVVQLEIGDMVQIFELASCQFKERCDSFQELAALYANIFYLFIPKLLWPEYMGHSVIGIKETIEADESSVFSRDRSKLLGFVDISLQVNSGSLDALRNEPLYKRKQRHAKLMQDGWVREKSDLRPYICNLLVAPVYRGEGYGRKLVKACEDKANTWGYGQINLHVESNSLPALALYLSEDFEIEKTLFGTPDSSSINANNILFMRKNMNRNPFLKNLMQ